ncbi:DUF3368 domain-containing protein [Candidatus Nitrospira bockiana]
MILVFDSSPLIALARVGRLHLIPKLAQRAYVPMAVYEEVVHQGTQRAGSAERVKDHVAVHRLLDRIGRGEAEAIILAREIRADFLVLDDATARHLAENQGVRVNGLLGLLSHGKHQEKIEIPQTSF